jgi:hypothetical protein
VPHAGNIPDRGKERGQTEEEFMMAVLCCCRWFLQQSTDSSIAGPELLCFLVTTMAEKLW